MKQQLESWRMYVWCVILTTSFDNSVCLWHNISASQSIHRHTDLVCEIHAAKYRHELYFISVRTYQAVVQGRFLCAGCYKWVKQYANHYTSVKTTVTSLVTRYRCVNTRSTER